MSPKDVFDAAVDAHAAMVRESIRRGHRGSGPVDRPIAKGDPVRTRKGAHFSGIVVVLYDSLGGYPHAVVEAVEPGFEGTEHLYPLGQLMLDEDAEP